MFFEISKIYPWGVLTVKKTNAEKDTVEYRTFSPDDSLESIAKYSNEEMARKVYELWAPDVLSKWEEKKKEFKEEIAPTGEPGETIGQQIDDLRMAQHETNMLVMSLLNGSAK